MPFSLKETTRLPDKTTILTLLKTSEHKLCPTYYNRCMNTSSPLIHLSAIFKIRSGCIFMLNLWCCAEKNVDIYAAKLCKCNLQLFDSFCCQLLLKLQECKKVQKKKIDWEYDAKCHFNTTQQAKQSERSIREIIENRWSIWPTGRLKQASLKVKNFEQVRARHAQWKRWVKASKHPSL